MSYKTALIIAIVATGAFILYIWQFDFPELEEELPQEITTQLRAPDAQAPAAGICDFYGQDSITFDIQEGIPQPRCARVLAGQKIAFTNSSEELLLFEFAGRPFAIEPGVTVSDGRRAEDYLAPGVHVVSMDFYGGSGPEIWVQDSRTFEVNGTITQQFVSARAFVVQTPSGDLSLAITSDTNITLPDGASVSADQFSTYIVPNTPVTVVAHITEANAGTALAVRIKSSNDENPVACTMEARLCPDGSAVGRVGPNCEFAPCPSE